MAEVDRVELPAAPTSGANTNARIEQTPSPAQPNNASNGAQTNGTQRPNILTGNLPDNFLRLDTGPYPQVMAPAPAMFAGGGQFLPTYYQKGGVLTATLSQARLAKNYGLSRMDPYCRIRVGNVVLETPTAYNGSKNPRWNKTFQVPVPEGVNRMYIELYDECSFSPDERVAWGLVVIKDEVIAGETVDDWYSLSGKQGEDKEGMINIILQYRESPIPAGGPAPMVMQPMPMMMQYGTQMAYGTQMPYRYAQPMIPAGQPLPQGMPPPAQVQQPPQQQPPQTISDEDVKKIKDMFPDMDDEIIRSVLLGSGGNVDTAVNHLLSMAAS
eukprot:Seg1011.1 transcript_id=Seg1011.1/GoldUCD/mRNA.D3Y31 product="Toll-interacting protein" protein_id=Seg1011.1/GoldUCD/D3Y31